MYKVLIADDEIKICKLIKCLVDWQSKDMEVIGVVHNGKEALEIVKSDKPDIIITDIRMPELDGLELIQELKAAQPDISFVIISGYRQFEYARKALQFGAEDYLLKPIKEHELNRVLDRIIMQKNNQRKVEDEHNQLKEISQEQIKKMQEVFVCDLVKGSIPDANLNEKFLKEEYYSLFPYSRFCLIGIKLDFESGRVKSTEMEEFLKKRIGAIVDNNLEFLDEIVFRNAVIDHIFYSFWNFAPDMERLLRHESRHIISDIRNTCSSEHLSVHVTIGMSAVVEEYKALTGLNLQVKKAIENRLVKGVDKIIDYEKQELILDVNYYLNLPWRKKLLDCIESRNQDRILQTLEDLNLKLKFGQINDGSLLYAIWREVIEVVLLGCRNCFEGNQMEQIKQEIVSSLEECYYQEMLEKQFIGKIMQLIEKSIIVQKEKDKKPIQEAKHYIQLYYKEALTLEEVGGYVGLNPVYFSSLFKQEEGVSFLEYLTIVRMKKAKELLMDCDKTMREIADSVGYQDEKYFSRAFKKTVGLTPSEYRKIYS